MRIKFLTTGDSPDYYTFQNEKVIAYKDGKQEEFDLSDLEQGDEFQGLEVEKLNIGHTQIIRKVKRNEYGELELTLCQKSPKGDWRGKEEWIDSEEYNKDKLYIENITPEEEVIEDVEGED